jgi:OOP family OmpA-OmpF porin
MLTAIQDFVRDSFEKAHSESLQSLRMDGDHGIWIEHGPEAVLAVAIRGIAPESLRARFRSLLEQVHARFSDQWRSFAGDTSVFALVQPELEQELVCELREPERRRSKRLWVACGLALALGLAWMALGVRERWRRDALTEALRAEPGLVLLAAESRDGTFWIEGLRDPGARDPHALIVASGLSVRERWTPFYALDADSVLRRARTILEPPDSVTLAYRAGTLTLAGRAPQRWIRAALDSAPGIAGVERVEAAGLQDPERMALADLEAALEQTGVYFEAGSAVLSEAQSGALADAAQRIREIQSLAAGAGLRVWIRVVGHADPTGSREFNRELSLARALAVQRALVERGASALDLSAIGQLPDVGSPKPDTSLHTLRNVQFRVAIDDSGMVLDD